MAALDYGVSQRALIDVSSRADVVAELITRGLATLAHSGLQTLDTATVRAVVDDLAASTHAIGELILEVAPAYLRRRRRPSAAVRSDRRALPTRPLCPRR